jgi:hypothetical protein
MFEHTLNSAKSSRAVRRVKMELVPNALTELYLPPL